MNARNTALGIIAIIFAIGSAFSSKDAITTIHVKYQGDADFTCQQVSLDCGGGSLPTPICRVIINTLSGVQITRAYSSSTCATALRSTSEPGSYSHPSKVIEFFDAY